MLQQQEQKQRQRTTQACDRCRIKRIRCSGDKPICKECILMSHSCHYSMINKRGPIRGVPRVKKTNSAKDGVKLMRLSEDEVKGEEDEGQDHPYQHPQQNQYYQHHHHQQSPPIFHHTHYSAHRSDETLVALALAAEHSAAMALEPEPVVGLESYHVSARGFSSDRPPESDLQAMIARFSRKVILQLVDLYFEQVANHQFSFVHKTSLVRGVHDGTADPMLVASICAICCKFSTLPLIQRDDDSSETFGALARQLVERQLDEPTLSSVQALLVLAMYEKGRGSNPRSWTYGGMAFRLVTFLELHRERPRISQISPSDWLTHETARRLYWTSYMLDRLSASGTARPHVFQEANSQLIPLPSSELQFQSVVPVDATILLEPAEIEDPGFMALVTRLTSIWGRITDYLSEGINYPTERSQGQLFQGLKNELYAWERRLGPMMRYNQHTLLCAVNAGEGGIFAYMHLLYDHCWSVLLRAYLIHHRHHINSDMIRTVCLEHAMHISQLITDAVKYPFLLNTPYSGYCIFLSSMILVTELADEENTQERELRRALAVNVNLLVQQKQYWSGAGYFCGVLQRCYARVAAAQSIKPTPVGSPRERQQQQQNQVSDSTYGTPTSLVSNSPLNLASLKRPQPEHQHQPEQTTSLNLGQPVIPSMPDTQWIENLYADLVYMPQHQEGTLTLPPSLENEDPLSLHSAAMNSNDNMEAFIASLEC